jgi:hypothetical protein
MRLTRIWLYSIKISGETLTIPAEAYRTSFQYFQKIKKQSPEFSFLSFHYRQIIRHVKKRSLCINNVIKTYSNVTFLRQLVHANSVFKPYVSSNEHAYLQLLWSSYVVWNRATLQSALINSPNEETCISERNLYRVETSVLSV